MRLNRLFLLVIEEQRAFLKQSRGRWGKYPSEEMKFRESSLKPIGE